MCRGFLFTLLLVALSTTQTQAQSRPSERPPRNQIAIHQLSTEKTDQPPNTAAIPADHALDTGGTGCRDGSVTHIFNPDATALTLIFSEFTASLDANDDAAAAAASGSSSPGTAAAALSPKNREKSRKFCGVNLGFTVPANWTFEIRELDWRGYVSVDAGVKASLRSVYFWRGERERDERVVVRRVVSGPKTMDLTQTSSSSTSGGGGGGGEAAKSKEGRTRLPCERKSGGSTLHVNTVVRVCREGECGGRGGDNAAAAGKGGGDGKKKDAGRKSGGGLVTVDSLDAKFKTQMQLEWMKC